MADRPFFIQPPKKFPPPRASSAAKGRSVSHALWHSPSGRAAPSVKKTCPSRTEQASVCGFSYRAARSG